MGKNQTRKIQNENEFVIELNDTNFAEFNRTNAFYFLEFYAGWCIKCSELIPIYEKAAQLARQDKLPMKFVKVDAVKNIKLSKQFKIMSYPTIFWVDNDRGRILKYSYEQKQGPDYVTDTAIDFLDYAGKALGNKLMQNVKSFEEINKLKIDLNALLFVCEYDNCHDKYNFQISNVLMAAHDNFYDKFLFTTSQEIRQKYNFTDEFNLVSFLVSKHTDIIGEGENIEFNIETDLSSTEAAKKLLSNYVSDIYGPIAHYEVGTIIERGDPSLILFYGNNTTEEELEEVNDFMRELAIKYRKTLHFYNSNLYSNDTQALCEYLGLTEEQMPLLLITGIKDSEASSNSEELKKYKLENAVLSEEIVEKFILDWQNGFIEIFLASEPIPENPYDEYGILKVVGKTFENFITTQGKDLILSICTDAAQRCSSFNTRFQRVAQKLKNNPNLLIARTDTTLNDFSVNLQSLIPAIFLFPSDRENLSVNERFANRIVYDGNLTTRNMTNFILQNATTSPLFFDTLDDEDSIDEEENMNGIIAQYEIAEQSIFDVADFLEDKLEEKFKDKDTARFVSRLLRLDELRAANYSASNVFKNQSFNTNKTEDTHENKKEDDNVIENFDDLMKKDL